MGRRIEARQHVPLPLPAILESSLSAPAATPRAPRACGEHVVVLKVRTNRARLRITADIGLRGVRAGHSPSFSRFMINSRCRSKAWRACSRARSIDTAISMSGALALQLLDQLFCWAMYCWASAMWRLAWAKCSLSRVASITAASSCQSSSAWGLTPVPRGCGAENGDGTERGKDRAENSVIHSPGDACAEQR
jgi:hypothetical protein